MKNIGKIFCADMHSLASRFLAFVVALVLCVAPGGFAWANIFADWDPYSNTIGLPIALCILDEGCDNEDGSTKNMGYELVEHLTENPSINWVVMDDDDRAINGVYSGEYYGAVIIEKDFSYKVRNMLTEWTGKPSVTYYINGKRNTVGNLMTDTAVGKVKTWLTQEYLEILSAQLLEETNSSIKTFRDNTNGDSLVEFLDDTVLVLESAIDTIDSVLKAQDNASEYIDPQALSNLLGKVNEMASLSAGMQYTTAKLCFDLNMMLNHTQSAVTILENSISDINEDLVKNRDPAADAAIQDAIDILQQGSTDLSLLADYLDIMPGIGIVPELSAILRDFADISDGMGSDLADFLGGYIVTDVLNDLETTLRHGRQLTQRLIPTSQDLARELDVTFRSLSDTLSKTTLLSYQAELLMNAADMMLGDLGDLLENVRPLVVSATDSLSRLADSLKQVKERGYLEALISFLESSPGVYSEFLSKLVLIDTTDAYPMENFGSAMAPFYSVLGIWMGVMLLVVCFKPIASGKGLVNPKLHELFFGRYLLFFLLAELQSLVIVLGDLYLLKIQCLNPKLFIISGLSTGFVFSLLAYALAVSFGTVGKGIVMISMAIQVAASTGTFPLELLPEGFQKIYKFFPAPYAIDAMRESIFGVYGDGFKNQLISLSYFAVAALFIGLVLRRPLARVNAYAENELAGTGIF